MAASEGVRPSPRLWQDVKRALEAMIGASLRDKAARLPNERALAEQLGVHRHTVRRAMAELETEGLVCVEQGRGTFIQSEMVQYRLGRRTRFAENLASIGLEPQAKLLDHRRIAADANTAAALRLRRGTEVNRLVTLRGAKGAPLSYSDHYLPAGRFDGAVAVFTRTRSISAVLLAGGVADYRRVQTRIASRLPIDEEAQLLKQPAGQPVLIIASISHDAQDRAVLYSVSRLSAMRMELLVDHI